MKRPEELLAAARDVLKDREGYDGTLEDIAAFWHTYITMRANGESETGYILSAFDVSMMMALMKIAREARGHKDDNLLDAVNYIALAAVAADEELPKAGYGSKDDWCGICSDPSVCNFSNCPDTDSFEEEANVESPPAPQAEYTPIDSTFAYAEWAVPGYGSVVIWKDESSDPDYTRIYDPIARRIGYVSNYHWPPLQERGWVRYVCSDQLPRILPPDRELEGECRRPDLCSYQSDGWCIERCTAIRNWEHGAACNRPAEPTG